TGLFVLDGSGCLTRVNRAAREVLGLEYADVLALRLDDLADREPWATAVEVVRAATRSAWPGEAECTETDTGRTWEVTAYRAETTSPDDERVILALRDVTRIAALQESLRKSETMSAMGSLVAGVAHEVRNPLFGISATVDVLECGGDAPHAQAEYLGLLRSEVARLSRLMQDLLDYGKPPALSLARAEIASILDAAIRACASEAREKDIAVALDVAPDVPALVVDGARMEQVFLNLVANAIHFSPRGARVRVSASVAAGAAGDEAVEVLVEDEGEGLTPDDIPRLFQPFFTRREEGTGLGLSIVQRVVEAHGGVVAAANHPPGGAAFRVRLPTAAGPRAAPSGVRGRSAALRDHSDREVF